MSVYVLALNVPESRINTEAVHVILYELDKISLRISLYFPTKYKDSLHSTETL